MKERKTLGDKVRERLTFILAVIGAVLGAIGFFQAQEAKNVATRVEADKLLDDAWDSLGGGKGTDSIGAFVSNPSNLELAARDIALARTMAPRYAKVFLLDSSLAAARGQYDESIVLSKKALELDPKLSGAYNRIGWVHTVKHEWPEAAAEFRHATELNQKDALAFSNLCWALLRQDKLSEASTACEQALKVNPSYKTAYHNLAAVRAAQGRTKEANNLQMAGEKLGETSKPV